MSEKYHISLLLPIKISKTKTWKQKRIVLPFQFKSLRKELEKWRRSIRNKFYFPYFVTAHLKFLKALKVAGKEQLKRLKNQQIQINSINFSVHSTILSASKTGRQIHQRHQQQPQQLNSYKYQHSKRKNNNEN